MGANHQNIQILDSPAHNGIIQSIKEDIIDAVNDLKAKSDIWNLSEKQVAKCDTIIKKMVFNSGSNEGHTYDLVRSLFDILREV